MRFQKGHKKIGGIKKGEKMSEQAKKKISNSLYGKRGQLKVYKEKDGYNVVWFTIKGVRRIHPVRKLVAEAFLGERPKGLWINHKNGKRDDDRVENLEYVTPRENALHGYRVNGRKHTDKQKKLASERFSGSKNPKAKLDKETVADIRAWRRLGSELKDIAKVYKISVAQVSAICNNNFWK